MIKYPFKISEVMQARYDHIVRKKVHSTLSSELACMPIAVKSKLLKILTPSYVNYLLDCPANELINVINDFYLKLPEIADYYYPYFHFNKINLSKEDVEPDATHANSKHYEKLRLKWAYKLTSTLPNSEVARKLSSDLWYAEKVSHIKNTLKKIINLQSETSRLQEDEKVNIPDWIKNFENIFSYKNLRNNIGYELVIDLNIDICLYCNKEEINTIIGRNGRHRAQLDHFHPQSKFPFLAVTLSNLIPSGHACNSSFKSDKLMFQHAHPYINGVGNQEVFKITPVFNGTVYRKDNFNIELVKQNNNIDYNFVTFEILSAYNQSMLLRNWVVAIDSNKRFFKGFGNEIERELKKAKNAVYVDLNDKACRVYAQKFKIDVINYFTGKSLKLP
ncbi:conserved hypothetical protein [Vibrio chagasii]|nr:conserved hypothetical protein [Vibrio chagasii]CAH6895395.1 conserved hypothetical protein [Vibrio chagasii]CAH6936449.1 conserved hypothetical protein [Vibrio chagasii]CAH6962477.1 conserved hypothetical protein [Vibrio chagasii]CAH7020125.1 conserved hypothetical protein [Vibrio chagasii]